METGSHENGSGVGEAGDGDDERDAGMGLPPEQPVRSRTAASDPIHLPGVLIEPASFHPAESRTTWIALKFPGSGRR
jgi:hypothetical protein